MKRALLGVIAATLFGATATGGVAQQTVASARTVKDSRPPKRTIVIDAGHGGRATGMIARTSQGVSIPEKQITLGIALKLEQVLRKRGVEVVMTRTTDKAVELEERGRIANGAHGDLFISIHVNAPGRPGSQERGFETYFLAEAKSEDERRVEAMENEVVRFEGKAAPKGNDALSFIINDMAQNEHLRESSDLAAIIQDFLGDSHPGPNRGVKQANFSVLRNAYMPAVLVETGFGTNGREAFWLSTDNGQRALAASIADAAMKYLEKYEKRINVGSPR